MKSYENLKPNLGKLFVNKPLNKKLITVIVGIVIALSFVGFMDSTFLLAKRLSGGPIPCVLGFTGCDEVSKSPHSMLFGIPLSAYGMIFYLAIGVLGILYLDTKKYIFARLILLTTTLGFLISLYFIYVQKFLIKSFCVYCILSAIISTILFIFGITIYKKLKP